MEQLINEFPEDLTELVSDKVEELGQFLMMRNFRYQ